MYFNDLDTPLDEIEMCVAMLVTVYCTLVREGVCVCV